MTIILLLCMSGFHPVGGEASPPKHPAFPPKGKREEEKRERRKKEVVGEGEHVYFCVAVQVISNPLVCNLKL